MVLFNMADEKIHREFQDSLFRNRDHIKNIDRDSSTSSIGEDSMLSNESESFSSSCDTTDDASSSNSCPASYDLSELMAQLPIKKGLSKFFEGKSESFTTLSRVTSIEDLAKKTTTPYRRKLKASKSCATSLNLYKPYTTPYRPIVSKKSTEPSPNFTGTSPQQRAA